MFIGGKKSRGWPFVLVLLCILLGLRLLSMGAAPTPVAFANQRTLEQAIQDSARTGMPALVLATADWCGACKSLKRGALSDAGVSTWITDNTHPVLLDVTSTSPQAAEFRVSAIPALILLRRGKEIARVEGDIPTKDLLAWLAEFSGPVADERARAEREGVTPILTIPATPAG